MRVVTLLTDFGLEDTYVGQVKGAILAVAPNATLVDLTHHIAPQDIRAGAFMLWSSVDAFPAGTIHLAIVDPGVGSKRKAIALRTRRGDHLIGPDNGLLVPAMERLGGLAFGVELSNATYWRPRPSRTFHGRDIFAPAAGHLAQGFEIRDLGQPLERFETPFSIPRPASDPFGVAGEILHVDGYGNLISNIPQELLPPRFAVRIGPHLLTGEREATYSAVLPGQTLVLVGSSGLLEISVRNGPAANVLQASRGDPVRVEWSHPSPQHVGHT